MAQPYVSVVIITRNREDALERCVRSVLESTYPNYEIVIIDNGTEESGRNIERFIPSLATDVPIKVLRREPVGFAQLRQWAVEASKGDLIVSVDDDCVLGVSNLAEIASLFKSDPTIGIIGGNITNVGFLGKGQYKGRGKIGINGHYKTVEDPYQADVFGSANMSFRRLAFDIAGGYDLFFAGGLEEADLTFAIKGAGFRVVYAPHIHVTHYHVPSRFRSRTDNVQTLRLYFYLKYFRPTTIAEWLVFLRHEIRFTTLSIKSIVYKFAKPNTLDQVGIKEQLLEALHDLSQVFSARLLIPYLIYLIWRRKRAVSQISSTR